ncbi:glycerate kinase type-2 family protein [Acidihalobacter aeolianus]|uniref:glycerate kinase type-2 family protein n=1 Tax=Acidihalobacter aeolianus TaxID=2792603 RepID=UPI0018D32D8F|nr:DUF4147 domain-containing protein [Acidihalobacter aeolianus]
MADIDPRQLLLSIYRKALAAVEGGHAVERWLRTHPPDTGPWHLVAVGKAAEAMTIGALAVLGDAVHSGLVITKSGHLSGALGNDGRFAMMYAEHPWPGEGSLQAGDALLDFIETAPVDGRLLFLISGGASSLVEVPVAGVDLAFLRRATDWLLASGQPIDEVNRVRQRLSRIKGGGLRRQLGGRDALALVVSDVPGDDPRAIGSGLLAEPLPGSVGGLPDWLAERLASTPADLAGLPAVPHYLVASLQHALDAARRAALETGYPVSMWPHLLAGDAGLAGREIATSLRHAPPGFLIGGGETTVMLPDAPGHGGRNQHFALAAATVLDGQDDCWLLAAGTDGTDGPTSDAGALVDGGSIERGCAGGLDPDVALERADAGSFLAVSGDLISTGPTGTNVMDLVIGLCVGSVMPANAGSDQKESVE